MANVTEVHEALNFVPQRDARGGAGGAESEDDSHWGNFGGWGVDHALGWRRRGGGARQGGWLAE